MTLLSIAAVACGPKAPIPPMEGEITLSLSSSAFQHRGAIPVKYTCDGQDLSPPLAWTRGPAKTRLFAAIMDDLDAPGGLFTHWIIFNVASDVLELPESIAVEGQLASGVLQGRNDFGRIGYSGPCPPLGRAHHCRFTLYALGQALDLAVGAPKKQVSDAMRGHILAQGQLTCIYQRQP